MSMFIGFPYEDRIELLTDGAVYLPNGYLVFTQRKVTCSPDVPAAITGRGDKYTTDKMTAACLSYIKDYGFHEGMIAIEREFDQWRAAGYDGLPFQLYIAGYDEKRGPVQFTVSSHPNVMHEGAEAMRINTLFGIAYGAPPVDQEEVATFLTEERIAKGCAEFGPELCQYLRGRTDHVIDDPEKRQIHIVGGHIDLTTVNKDGASTRRLMTWPDLPLEFIDPTLQPVVEPTPAPTDSGQLADA